MTIDRVELMRLYLFWSNPPGHTTGPQVANSWQVLMGSIPSLLEELDRKDRRINALEEILPDLLKMAWNSGPSPFEQGRIDQAVALMRSTENIQDPDRAVRHPACKCHQEPGDSWCVVHGQSEISGRMYVNCADSSGNGCEGSCPVDILEFNGWRLVASGWLCLQCQPF